MKLLVVGGTRYVGRAIVDAALAAGHDVTLFNRGLSNPELFPEVEHLVGDRQQDAGLDPLRGREWDAAIDTIGYDHRVVGKTLEVLRGNVGHYTFVSSISVYKDFLVPHAEDDPTAELLGDPDVPLSRPHGGSAHYGPMKVLSERAVAEAFPGRWSSVRLTIGVGPGFIGSASALGVVYWARRVRDHETILVPGPPDRAVNVIDVRDMAAFVISGAEAGRVGAFNAATPRTTILDALTLCMGLYGARPELVFADPDWLLEQGVAQNREIPWWIADEQNAFYLGVNPDRARAAGLRTRPLAESIRDSVEWAEAHPIAPAAQAPTQAGQSSSYWDATLTRERELELITAWREHTGRRAPLAVQAGR
jgi:2'-hydroxyisoflavone reductase